MDKFLNQLQSPPSVRGAAAADEAYMNGIYDGFNLRSLLNQASGAKLPSLVSVEARSGQNQKRRRANQRVTEKAMDLQRLLPADKKMDTATTLEEAYKYIKFLEAQVSVLQKMPMESGGGGGAMSRQEMLQLFVNSPAAQKWLSANGCCVYAIEQLASYASNPNSLFSAR